MVLFKEVEGALVTLQPSVPSRAPPPPPRPDVLSAGSSDCLPCLPQGWHRSGLAAPLLPCLSQAACCQSQAPAPVESSPSNDGPGLAFCCEWLLAKVSCSLIHAAEAGQRRREASAGRECQVCTSVPRRFDNPGTVGTEQEVCIRIKAQMAGRGVWKQPEHPRAIREAAGGEFGPPVNQHLIMALMLGCGRCKLPPNRDHLWPAVLTNVLPVGV